MNKRLTAMMPSILIMLFVVGYLITAFLTLDATSRRVPVLFAFSTLILLAIDLLLNRPPEPGSSTPRGREITAIGFVAGGVAGIYLLGFMIAVPLYLVLSITYLGAQPLRVAIVVALIASASIYLIFEIALSYRLFAGILFS